VGGVSTSLVAPLTQKSAAKEALIFGLSRKGRVKAKALLSSCVFSFHFSVLLAISEAMTKSTVTLDSKLLEILVCPLTKGHLRYDETAQELISEQAKLAYPVRDGIPIMLPEEARKLDD
jgi:uncharacterized protein YbaR (Trm112 family)